jgi:large subunit ribosomal protein L30
METKMLAVIRIKGQVGLNKDINETLYRLRLRRKYICVIFENPDEVELGMINKVKNLIAFGNITKETYEELKKKRGLKDPNNKGQLKPFFRLHPPRGGIESKKHFGVGHGVLGDNKDKINDLILRML